MLRLLLDEHISPAVAEGLRRRHRTLIVHALTEWEDGRFLGLDDTSCLLKAASQQLTFVTYDRRTIPPLLKIWAEEERTHAGVIFIDEKTIPQANIGRLVNALSRIFRESGAWDWTNLVCFLQK